MPFKCGYCRYTHEKAEQAEKCCSEMKERLPQIRKVVKSGPKKKQNENEW